MNRFVSAVAIGIQAVSALASPEVEIHLEGDVAWRMAACCENHVKRADALRFAEVFESRTETSDWQGEFWGKYMLGAAAFYAWRPDPGLRRAMDASTARVIATQDADGYIGNYAPSARFAGRWDVWSAKYTMEGLLAYHAVTGDRPALAAAEKLAGRLMAEFGPGKREIRKTGMCHSLPSCSVLETFVKLHRVTGRPEYLDFARYVVAQLDEEEDSARLVRDALAGIDVADRDADIPDNLYSARKAYEMMSCCVGLLEYAVAANDARCRAAVVKTAENILKTEIMVTGSGASREFWFHGATKQVRPYLRLQETCVTVTWLRLLARLIALTDRADFADAFECTFHNAYLAALRPDGGAFSSYTALDGWRCYGQDHCKMYINCCNANGPRGFTFFRETQANVRDDGSLAVNLYASGTMAWRTPSGVAAKLEAHTRYPEDNVVRIVNRTRETAAFCVRVRIPSWSAKTTVTLNGSPLSSVTAGTYLALDRTWAPGDAVEIAFDYSVRTHVIGDAVSFAVGPLVLAHDARLGKGVTSALRSIESGVPVPAWRVRVPAGVKARLAYALLLDDAGHDESPHDKHPSSVLFCDFASAGATWDETSAYQTWFPLQLRPSTNQKPVAEIDLPTPTMTKGKQP